MLIKRFGAWGSASAIFVVPASFGAWELWTGWPIYAALNFDTNSVVKHVAALLTAAATIATFWAFARLMPGLQALPDWYDEHRKADADMAAPRPVSQTVGPTLAPKRGPMAGG